MATIITLISSFCLIIIAIRIKIYNSKKAKKDAENFMGIINPLMYKDYKTIKSYTSLEQSKKLAEFLPLETADMFWMKDSKDFYEVVAIPYSKSGADKDDGLPCWSLASLLSVLPKIGAEEPMVRKLYYTNEPKERYICQYSLTNITSEYDNPVNTCVEMVLKLHKLNLI